MPPRRNGHTRGDVPLMDKGSGVAGKRGRGRPPRDPNEVLQINYPDQDEIKKFTAVYLNRKKESEDVNALLAEHMSHHINAMKWPRPAVRILAMLVRKDALEAQAIVRWLNHAFALTEQGKQTDLVDELAAARSRAVGEAVAASVTV